MTATPLQSRGLFATRVHAFDLEPERVTAINGALWPEIDRLLTPRPAVQPWQTRTDLQLNPAFAPLVESTSWRAGFLVAAALPVVAVVVLRPLRA